MRAKSLAPPNGLAESESTPDTRKLHMDVPVGRRTSMASLCSLMIERPDSEFTLGPLEKGRNCWSEPPATSFPVRGKKYMTDKKKYNSAESMFILVDVDIFRSTTPGRFTEFASSGVSYIDYATAHGETRFMVCMHFQSNTYNMVCTWVVDPARYVPY
ncbi:hypothetical protein SARC_03404 [Sphaeroforma arctica JP610]|uniref:Protein ENHANCED DISEASE RESISTANCE 2 C-terminal domain-containing protein n=1 Tax=Sphaeroforma arctica JP610 TaxID=667725 RepID=A0A0L0G5Y1_9EUKA|nr:hypothetical protein SARC_03404 [Sphaeroforma arctica JP610]KNC84359.1 hypothetical protein SARC_03404 [Sphaeroforma arctica JP610]|eukprot:XP_014158261.1 hypothetical protein SARC_03404 [Sphaeroforma arctica JP610]